jgi:hypothetical protein
MPLLNIYKIKEIAIEKIWIKRYRLPINQEAKSKLSQSSLSLKKIVHHFDRYYHQSIPEERNKIFIVAYHYFPRKIPFWVLIGLRFNIKFLQLNDD